MSCHGARGGDLAFAHGDHAPGGAPALEGTEAGVLPDLVDAAGGDTALGGVAELGGDAALGGPQDASDHQLTLATEQLLDDVLDHQVEQLPDVGDLAEFLNSDATDFSFFLNSK